MGGAPFSAQPSMVTNAFGPGLDTGQDPGPSQVQLPSPVAKKGRTNTPWTPAEEQRLKTMRDAGSSWSEIAKTFPLRTEGSVKKHWYKVRSAPVCAVHGWLAQTSRYDCYVDTSCRTCITPSLPKMRLAISFASPRSFAAGHYGADWIQSAALLQAIKDYETNKWKVIGQKVGKPAKVCTHKLCWRSSPTIC